MGSRFSLLIWDARWMLLRIIRPANGAAYRPSADPDGCSKSATCLVRLRRRSSCMTGPSGSAPVCGIRFPENPRESLSELARLGARLIIQRAVAPSARAVLGRGLRLRAARVSRSRCRALSPLTGPGIPSRHQSRNQGVHWGESHPYPRESAHRLSAGWVAAIAGRAPPN